MPIDPHFNPGRVLPGIFLFFALSLLPGCQATSDDANDQASAQNPEEHNGDRSIVDANQTTLNSRREFPLLNDGNAIEFLNGYFKENPERNILVTTRVGSLKVRLFDDTPIHTANFLMLVNRKYFDGTEFTRVVKDFVVQGGNNDSETEEIKRLLIGNYEMPAEIHEAHLHKKGALSMARSYENNPEKVSTPYNYFFVDGRTFNEPQLLALERDHNMKIPAWKREIYRNIGGAPHLDGQHTVFGEVYEGLDVLERMAEVKTDDSDWPLDPLIVKMEVIP